jgi:hypothetical protein
MVYKLKSSRSIVARLFRQFRTGYSSDMFADTIEFIGDAVQALGLSGQTVNKIVKLTTQDHRAELPCDIVKLNNVAFDYVSLQYGSGDFSHHSMQEEAIMPSGTLKESYKLEPDYIKTQSESIDVYIDYQAFPTDEEGYPMIPDAWVCEMAITYYVITMFIESGVKHPVLSYEAATANWEKYRKQAKFKLKLPDKGRFMNIKRQWVRLIPHIRVDEQFFHDLDSNEHIDIDA